MQSAFKESRPYGDTWKWALAGVILLIPYWIWFWGFQMPAKDAEASLRVTQSDQCRSLVQDKLGAGYSLDFHRVLGYGTDNKGPNGSMRVRYDVDVTNKATGRTAKNTALCTFAGEPAVYITTRQN